MTLILASSSPWKLDVLRSVGLEVKGMEHGVDEAAFFLERDVEERVRLLAEAKAFSLVQVLEPDTLVVATDQVLELDGKTFGKVNAPDEARAVLSLLQGRRHRLLCGWALVRRDRVKTSGTEIARLRMRPLTDDEIRRYVETDEWMGMAGCYRYESTGRQLFESLEGDYHAVLGMPLASLLPALRQEDVVGLL